MTIETYFNSNNLITFEILVLTVAPQKYVGKVETNRLEQRGHVFSGKTRNCSSWIFNSTYPPPSCLAIWLFFSFLRKSMRYFQRAILDCDEIIGFNIAELHAKVSLRLSEITGRREGERARTRSQIITRLTAIQISDWPVQFSSDGLPREVPPC